MIIPEVRYSDEVLMDITYSYQILLLNSTLLCRRRMMALGSSFKWSTIGRHGREIYQIHLIRSPGHNQSEDCLAIAIAPI